MAQYIGISFSWCILDLVKGNVRQEDVLFILGDCKVDAVHTFESLLEYYSKLYWKGHEEQAVAIAKVLHSEGRLYFTQKRFGINVAGGHWAHQLQADYQMV